ncbi:MAG: Lrp/AsnC family transcriptional regulator [Gammaproteobacteria bacterium]|nr:Lrp/AsnC family transcriptional regulator [Gammaproteobacteria bacterium]
MDRTDLKILDALQKDGRQSNQALADRIGISAAACWRRVKALEEDGVIQRYAALLSRPKLGLNLCAFVHISLARHVQESTVPFERAVLERAEVMECFATTGDADFILRVVTSSIEAFDKFLVQFLFGLPQVSQVRSNIALRELKMDTALALPTDSKKLG